MSYQTEAIKRFVDKIYRRNLPIDPQDAINFGEAIIECGFSPKKLKILAGQLNFISRDVVDERLYQLAQEFKSVVNNQPYGVVRYPSRGSGLWIYDQLVRYGAPPQAAEIVLDRYSSSRTDLISKKREESSLLVEKGEVNSFWIFDDFSYSGSHAMIMTGLVSPSVSLNAGFIGLSRKGTERLQQHCHTILSHLPIYDCRHLRNIQMNGIEKTVFGIESDSFNYLTWSALKVPDNIPDILIGNVYVGMYSSREKNIPPLIRPEKFIPPYPSWPQVSTNVLRNTDLVDRSRSRSLHL